VAADDPDLVVKRIKDFVQSYNVKGLFFNDSNFFFDLHRGRLILEGLIKENLNVSISNINIDFHHILRIDGRTLNCFREPAADVFP